LAQQNGFGSEFLHSLLRLVLKKKKAQQTPPAALVVVD
jgi:hypothetical protein